MPARSQRGAVLRVPRTVDKCSSLRRFVARRPMSVVGLFPSEKADGGMIRWGSLLEQDALCLFEADPDVLHIRAQPEVLRVVVNGQPHDYAPQFLIRGHGGKAWFADIRKDKDADLPVNQVISAAVSEECLRKNVGYVVLKESWIRREPRLNNAKLMLRYRKLAPSLDLRIRVTRKLDSGPTTFGGLLHAIQEPQAYGQIMALLLDGTIATDLKKLISERSIFWIRNRGDAQ